MKSPNQNHEGLAMYKAIIERKTQRAKRIKRCFQAALLVGLVAPVLSYVYFGVHISDSLALLFPVCFVLLVFSLFSSSTQRLTVDEYKALPGSTDRDGNHRCIACGNKGIHRRTIYRTTTTVAACSKCEQPLWAVQGDS